MLTLPNKGKVRTNQCQGGAHQPPRNWESAHQPWWAPSTWTFPISLFFMAQVLVWTNSGVSKLCFDAASHSWKSMMSPGEVLELLKMQFDHLFGPKGPRDALNA